MGSPDRLKTQWFHILLALAAGDAHGAAIRERVHEQSEGAVRLWPAMLYGSLEELAARGWIEELPDERHPQGESDRRRIYRITAAGRRAMAAETARLERLVRLADRLQPGQALR